MTFGQQPQGNSANGFNGQPYGQNQYNQNPYVQNQYQYAPQGAYAQSVPAQATYSYERAERVSVTRAYGEMTIGLLVTAAVAILTQVTGAYIALIQTLGVIGVWAPLVVEIVIAIYLGARIEKINPSTARVMFYVYAAIMGFSLSTIFMAYDLGTIGISLAMCAGFFFALTMLGMTTKVNVLKAGPVLLVGLIVLIIAEVLLMIFAPGQTTLMVISAIGLVLFAGMTVYDAQATRALFAQYEGQGEDMIKKVSIICALNLYLDFINMFLYILQLFGGRD
ncbi:MAG: Bax inhibitor-1/YccA family protein [Bifidobacterium ruminantium]|uniref:Bax inhibitor-1/YccA family protein n=1 Tax=uncultured Bifidobacterium sp. TaxID=165187 RepID=UPI00258B6519|nr:Bax inhibitor-1/YccA family protein [uncultured Bifidobacterium sp.]MEE0971076.1 Bax inhibitor-1/YccA family protein [Bifidobacterium ruminantium]